ncbi:hypothetical protein [Haloplanus rubicundus]|nr:hypothetical protein [Haloplanus rubicundus]
MSAATTNEWLAGAGGGFVGSVLFGLIMMYVVPAPMLSVVIPAMYGIEGPALLAGWAIHQFHGVALGLAYVALVRALPGRVRSAARDRTAALGLGVAYGVLTTAVLAVLVMPVWLGVVGFAGAPPFPNVSYPGTLVSLVGHVVYAIPVAVAYALTPSE